MDDYQMSYGGLTIGAGTDYGIAEVTGLEGFTARATDDFTASRWGTIVGADQVESRTVFLSVRCRTEAAAQALASAFRPPLQTSPATLLPLAWKMPGAVEQYVSARCRRRSKPRQPSAEAAKSWVVSVELHAPDPRAYATSTRQAAVNAFMEASYYLDLDVGSGTDLGYNLATGTLSNIGTDFLGDPGTGTVFVLNDGNTETWPTVTFTAPAGLSYWRLRNLTTEASMDFVYPLGAGQRMVVDLATVATTKPGDAVLVDGAARYSAWQHPRTPMVFPAGLSELRLDILDGDSAGLAVVEWADAYI